MNKCHAEFILPNNKGCIFGQIQQDEQKQCGAPRKK